MATKPQSDYEVRLERANVALARGDWASARVVFDALVVDGETAEAVEGLSWAAWWQDDGETLFSARERAYHLFRERGDLLGAARMAIWLGNDYIDFYGELAVANGWLQLAQRLLDDLPTSEEHGWLAVLNADFALTREDTTTAREQAQRASSIGRQVRSNDVDVIGRTIEGLALVSEGQMNPGMALLDGAAAEALSGGLKELFTVSMVLCHLLYACERARDYERAAQWCQRTKDYADRMGFTFAQGTCRVHYASVLLWRGMWAEAERELSEASHYLGRSRPPYESEARVRLAELRRRQGRLEEAEALFREVDWHPLAPLGLAELALHDGRHQDAEEYVQRVLRGIPEVNLVQRSAALDVLVRVLAAAGKHAEAGECLKEFEHAAQVIGTLPLRASATASAGEVALAAGDYETGRGHLEDAIALFERCHAPYEVAKARLALAETLLQMQRRDRARQEAARAHPVLLNLGARLDAARAESLATGGDAPGRQLAALTARQIEVLRLVARGMNDREIAASLVMSEHTVHRHVANILQRLDEPSRAAAVAHASRLGIL